MECISNSTLTARLWLIRETRSSLRWVFYAWCSRSRSPPPLIFNSNPLACIYEYDILHFTISLAINFTRHFFRSMLIRAYLILIYVVFRLLYKNNTEHVFESATATVNVWQEPDSFHRSHDAILVYLIWCDISRGM